MPFGPIPFNKKLGIANGNMPDAAGFANIVLRLTGLIPVYQGQLVHSVNWAQGCGAAAAEWCSTADISYGQTGYIREISGNDTRYARRNLNDAQTPANALLGTQGHANNTSNQVYYFGNEPETYSALSGLSGCTPTDYKARNTIIDSYLLSTFPNSAPDLVFFWEKDTANPIDTYRTKAEALAYSFLKIRSQLTLAPYASHSHTVLPPCVINIADLGQSANAGIYWTSFFSKVKQGFTSYASGGAQTGLSLAELKVLHAHYYDSELRNWPLGTTLPADLPVTSVAKLAIAVRRGADWLREIYGISSNTDIPIDIYLSECGPDWRIQLSTDPAFVRLPLYWAGGWPDFQSGLSWWNTWLCWLTRVAGYECKLQGWNTGAHTLHADMHEPIQQPYVTQDTQGAGGWSLGNFRNQAYFNCDNAVWAPGVVINAETINSLALAEPGRFKRSFSSFPDTPWDYGGVPYRFWRSAPLAACYKVWSEIGNDPDPASFGSGWYANTAAGPVGTYSISIPAGYSTIYFPLMKSALGAGIYPISTIINFIWLKQDANGNIIGSYGHGSMSPSEMTDSKSFTDFNPWNVIPSPHYNQNIYSSMLFPAVCYSSAPKTIKIRLDRNQSGPQLKFGRPIVLPFACSWFSEQ